MVIFSEQPADRMPSMLQVPDVQVQIPGALLCAPMGDFEIYFPKLHPIQIWIVHVLSLEADAAGLLLLCRHPLPRYVQILEVDIRAGSAYSACLSLYTQHGVLGQLSPRNVNQDVLARLQ